MASYHTVPPDMAVAGRTGPERVVGKSRSLDGSIGYQPDGSVSVLLSSCFGTGVEGRGSAELDVLPSPERQ
jgi:hypothetical protein